MGLDGPAGSRQAGRQTDQQTDIQAGRQKDGRTSGRHSGRLPTCSTRAAGPDRQTDRRTDRHRQAGSQPAAHALQAQTQHLQARLAAVEKAAEAARTSLKQTQRELDLANSERDDLYAARKAAGRQAAKDREQLLEAHEVGSRISELIRDLMGQYVSGRSVFGPKNVGSLWAKRILGSYGLSWPR
jgi:hypothetical protein